VVEGSKPCASWVALLIYSAISVTSLRLIFKKASAACFVSAITLALPFLVCICSNKEVASVTCFLRLEVSNAFIILSRVC